MFFIERLVVPADLPLHRDALPVNPSAKTPELWVFFFFLPLSRPITYSSSARVWEASSRGAG